MANTPTQYRVLTEGTQLGSYAVVRLIAEGGMGTVYEGIHQTLGKRVAIKTLHDMFVGTPEVVERFLREGKAAAKISHQNVVDVIDVALHDGTPYLVMEYLEGEDLGTRLERDGQPMAAQMIADLMVPIASALSAVHAAGIVHRDLKPENIFLARSPSGAIEPKLVDFGISKFKDPDTLHLTGSHVILGTPYYMSPEQAASSKEIDLRSDIFSFGVILYECAAGERPFKARSLLQLLDEIRSLEPRPLRTIVKELPHAFTELIACAMQKDPSGRFQSAADAGAALLPFASARVRLNYEREFGDIKKRTQLVALDSLAATSRAAGASPPRAVWLLGACAAIAAGIGLWAFRPGVHSASKRTAASAVAPGEYVAAPVADLVAPPRAKPVPTAEANAKPAAALADAGVQKLGGARSERASSTAPRARRRAHPTRAAAADSHASEPAHAPAADDDLFRDRK